MDKYFKYLRQALFISTLLLLFSFIFFRTESTAAERSSITTDILSSEKHEQITWELIRMVEHDQQLKALLETAIRQAAEMNPDLQTNPVQDLESYYDFIDWSAKAMPWEISPQTD